MLIYTECFRLDVESTNTSPNNIFLSDGVIKDTQYNRAYSVVDVVIPKVLNTTTFVYYDIYSRSFINSPIEYNLNTITIDHPNLCPIIRVTLDANQVVSYSYYKFASDTNTITPSDATIASNGSAITTETTQIFSNTIVTNSLVLGVINIYVHNYGDIDLTSVVDIDSANNRITLMDSTFGGSSVTVTYLSQRLFT